MVGHPAPAILHKITARSAGSETGESQNFLSYSRTALRRAGVAYAPQKESGNGKLPCNLGVGAGDGLAGVARLFRGRGSKAELDQLGVEVTNARAVRIEHNRGGIIPGRS